MESNKKKQLMIIFKIMISVSLLAGLIIFADIDKIISSLQGFKLKWLPLIFLLITLSVVVSTFKWEVLVKAQNVSIRFSTLFGYYIIGLFFNNFLPSSIGGDGVRIYLTGKKTNNYSSAASSVVVERILATVTLAWLGIVSVIFAQKPSQYAVVLLIILFIAGLFLTCILLTGWVPQFVRNKDGKISNAWISFADSSGELKHHPQELMICLFASLVFQIIVSLVIGAIMIGLNQTMIPLPDLFLVTSASSVLAMVPIGLNGYGMREGAYIYLLQPFGYTPSAALTVSVLFALFVSMFSLIGGIYWIRCMSVAKKAMGNMPEGAMIC